VGLLNILMGLFLFLVGISSLLRYQSIKGDDWRGLLVGGLLFLNFPLAAFYLLSAVAHMSDCMVQIVNESGAPVESFVIKGPGVDVEAGPIRLGGRARRFLSFHGDGTLDYSLRQQELDLGGQLSEYVTGGMVGELSVNIKPGGKVEVSDNLWVD
jgi:hypothetical protein